MIINTYKLREINNELVRTALRNSEYSTKNSISRETGLSISTCRNILSDMLKTGEVKEIELRSSEGGRPSRQFIYNKNYAYVGIMYLRIEGDTSYIYSSVINMVGEVLFENREELESIEYSDVDRTVAGMISEFPKLEVVSIGIPGVVIDGYIGLCDVVSLRKFHLKKKLEEIYSVRIIMENDVNTACLGYFNNISGEPVESIIYLYYPDQGIPGAGIVINGRVIRGETNFAGEIGFLPLGVEYEDQGVNQSNKKSFFDVLTKTILSLNSVINPKTIIVSWKQMDSEFFNVLNDTVSDLSPDGHEPELVFNSDHHNDYVKGLTFMAIKEMSCKLEVVERC